MSDFVFTDEVLADGQILDVAISGFLNNKTKEDLYKALMIFRSSKVWVPCRKTSFSKGESGKPEIRYVPELVTNGDENYYIPVFSNVKHMDKIDSDGTKVNKPVTEVIEMAKTNTNLKIKGLVLNPYTQPFTFDREIWDSILKMESLIK